MKKENPRIPVISPNGSPLMPTTASRARRWIKQGKAKSFWNDLGIWYVQLLTVPSGNNKQEIAVGSDPGKRYSGIGVQSSKFTLFMSHLVLLGFIPKLGTAIAGVKEKMSYRSMLRRGRRGRRIDISKPFRLRNHRQKRFSNRKKTKLAPSIRSNRQLELRVITELCRIYPVTVIVVEKVRADVDQTSGRKGASSGKGFSPVMVGQYWMICYNADSPIERLNVADTAKIQFNAFLKKGMVIYSDMGCILFSITEDTSGYNDLICGCSNAASNAAKYGEGDYNNSRNNFLKALGKRGLTRKDLMPNLNLFSRVAVRPNGDLEYVAGYEKPGSFIDLRAEMNVLVVISNCPHVLHPDTVYKPKPIQLTVWKSPAPAPDDLCRTANEEVIRGFINTDALFAQK